MKKLLLISAALWSMYSYSQHTAGFVPTEARDMIQICNSFTYLDLYGSDSEIIPANYVRSYTSPAVGMDNKFQIYTHTIEKKAVVNFRGSTDKKSSWLANMYSSMIPASDKIVRGGATFDYTCAENREATIHAGYMLAVSYLAEDLLQQIKQLNSQGIYTIYITGHSQGGALAQLCRAYLNFLPKSKLSNKNAFKVYAFANPMVGNKEFAQEYKKRFADPGFSFLIHNPADFVTKMPVSYDDTTFLKSNLQTLLFDRENFSMKESMKEGLLNMMGSKIGMLNNFMSNNVQGELAKELGEFKMPDGKVEANYIHTSEPILIPATEYPLELKDSSILHNDSLMRVYKRDQNGVFEDKSVYKKQKEVLQHKPYNYYTALLKVYFNEEYTRMDQKYFVLPKK